MDGWNGRCNTRLLYVLIGYWVLYWMYYIYYTFIITTVSKIISYHSYSYRYLYCIAFHIPLSTSKMDKC